MGTEGLFMPETDTASPEQLGGKAWNLLRMQRAGVRVPPWVALTDEAFSPDGTQCRIQDLPQRLRKAGLQGRFFAVRSSASGEDGMLHSFAGQLDTLLGVRLEEVAGAAVAIRKSAANERVRAYCREQGIAQPPSPTVIIQEMIDARSAGVAFACNLESGSRREETVSAVYGLGEGLVSGRLEADCYFVSPTAIRKQVAEKREAIELQDDGGTARRAVPNRQWNCPALSDAQIREVAAAARKLSQAFGVIQDIEWAYDAQGTLFLLQARPVTTLAQLPDPDGVAVLWDNSNIVESYPGMTSPLTFSFIRTVYSEVYQGFCKIMGVEPELIAANRPSFEMLGLLRGRVYYNLMNWYRLIALLPGYELNAPFMEQMMGVKEPLQDRPALLVPPRRNPYLRLVTMSRRLLGHLIHLKRDVHLFQKHFGACVGPYEHADFAEWDFARLKELYSTLERELLPAWQTPIVNDFMAMVFYGLLKKLLLKWKIDPSGGLHNDLIAGEGDIISAEPARRLTVLASQISAIPALKDALATSNEQFLEALAQFPNVRGMLDDYLDQFGDRCIGELKLETVTYRQDPTLLLDILRGYVKSAGQVPAAMGVAPDAAGLRARAERLVRQKLFWHPLRRMLFFWVLKHARCSVRNRENLRFERTRLFAVVRRIFLAFGKKLAMEGVLSEARMVFFLEQRELFDWASGTATSWNLAELVRLRSREYEQFAKLPPPAERFFTSGAIPQGNRFQKTAPPASANGPIGDHLQGLPCCGGVVRGIAKVVLEPSCAVDVTGCILVAVRTDPGWAPLFPVCKGVLVERGSILSHAAIVTRELGIPSIVGIARLTEFVHDGDFIEMNGSTGVIRKLEKSS